jgi:hypothetical protein
VPNKQYEDFPKKVLFMQQLMVDDSIVQSRPVKEPVNKLVKGLVKNWLRVWLRG